MSYVVFGLEANSFFRKFLMLCGEICYLDGEFIKRN